MGITWFKRITRKNRPVTRDIITTIIIIIIIIIIMAEVAELIEE